MVTLKSLNLLFLEDNPEYAKNTIEFLSSYFHTIYHATNVNDSIELFNKETIDVIISDVKVENGNGLDFIVSVRESNQEIPIVVISAHKDTEFLLKAIPLQIFSYEIKPIRFDDMIHLLQRIAESFTDTNITPITQNLSYNNVTKELHEHSHTIILTKKESLFIESLLRNKNTILSNAMIQKDVYEDKPMSPAAIKNLVLRLRKKISTPFIFTATSLGYRLALERQN